jgi:hypothetical protein
MIEIPRSEVAKCGLNTDAPELYVWRTLGRLAIAMPYDMAPYGAVNWIRHDELPVDGYRHYRTGTRNRFWAVGYADQFRFDPSKSIHPLMHPLGSEGKVSIVFITEG